MMIVILTTQAFASNRFIRQVSVPSGRRHALVATQTSLLR